MSMYICQSTYQVQQSTETAVTIIHKNIVRSTDRKDRVFILVLLDLTEAFDMVHPEIISVFV